MAAAFSSATLFLDTSGLLSIAHQDELHHSLAAEYVRTCHNAITHNYILAEFLALAFVRGLPRYAALEFVDAISHSPDIHITWISEKLHQQGMSLLRARLDKGFTLCDAISFALMRSIGVQAALTTDKHFVQEGFVRLLER